MEDPTSVNDSSRKCTMFPVEMITRKKHQPFQFDTEIPEGETMQVSLHTENQFIVPSDQIQFVLSHENRVNYDLLAEDITTFVEYDKRAVPREDIFEGFSCLVNYTDRYWRAIVISFPRVDMIKCLLLDKGVIALVHTNNVYHLHLKWTMFEPRVLTCRLDGLSAFSNSFNLLFILKNQIDWKGSLTMTVTKRGVNPLVVVNSSTYPHATVNQVILNYLYLVYDPRRLLQLHQRWPDTIITTNDGDGQVDIKLDTPLLRHVQERLKITSQADQILWVDLIRSNVVYLGIFGNSSEYERCTFRSIYHDDDSVSSNDEDNFDSFGLNLEVTFIDTGVKKRYSEDFEFNLIESLPEYPALTRIPPLAAQVQFNKVNSIPANFLKDVISKGIRVTIHQVETRRERDEIPLVEVFEQVPGRLLHINQIFLEALDPTTEPHHGYTYRHFSSLRNWSMPLIGNNWGKGSERVFDLVEGTKIYGTVTHIDIPGYFYIRPLEVKPLPRLGRGIPVLEDKCGCIWDGEFFRFKKTDIDEKNVRCRLMSRTLPPTIPHLSEDMMKIKVPVYFVDKGIFGEVSPLQLRKSGEKSAEVPPQVALVRLSALESGDWSMDQWNDFAKTAVGKTFHMKTEKVSLEEADGYLALTVKILAEVAGLKIPQIPESNQKEEEW